MSLRYFQRYFSIVSDFKKRDGPLDSVPDLVKFGGVFKGRHRERGGKIFFTEFRGFLCRLDY